MRYEELTLALFAVIVVIQVAPFLRAFKREIFGERRVRGLSQTPLQSNCSIKQLSDFMKLIEQMKLKKRLGWIECGIDANKVESIADHSYRMAMMTLFVPSDLGLDRFKCVKMALVHDLAEAITTDITPSSPLIGQKNQLENEAMHQIKDMLKGNPFGEEAFALWQEYAANETPEAKFVKQLDKTELIYQVVSYENEFEINFKEWIDNAMPKITQETLSEMSKDILAERPEKFKE